jgi:hypothetical protein
MGILQGSIQQVQKLANFDPNKFFLSFDSDSVAHLTFPSESRESDWDCVLSVVSYPKSLIMRRTFMAETISGETKRQVQREALYLLLQIALLRQSSLGVFPAQFALTHLSLSRIIDKYFNHLVSQQIRGQGT